MTLEFNDSHLTVTEANRMLDRLDALEAQEEHHELRIVTHGATLLTYCPCGWLVTFGESVINVPEITAAYREHLT